MSVKNKYLAYVILVGGKSSRFGTDKGLFEYKGKPLVSYLIETLCLFSKDIFLVANSSRQAAKYIEKIEIDKITGIIIDEDDSFPNLNLRTPMIGLYSAFKELFNLGYENTFAFSCDMPFIKEEAVNLMIKESNGFDCVIPIWDNGYIEPLFAIYPNEKGIKAAKTCLQTNQVKLSNLLQATWNINFISIEKAIRQIDEDLAIFININELRDLNEL